MMLISEFYVSPPKFCEAKLWRVNISFVDWHFVNMEFLLNPSLAHLVLRVVLGALFIPHGWAKFKNFFGVSAWFDSIGLKPGKFWLAIVVSVEFAGGIFLVLGLFTQIVGMVLAILMGVAMWKVKWGKVGLTDSGGWELDFIYFAVALALVLGGGGTYALDNLL